MGMCTTDTNTLTLTFYRLIKICRSVSVCACVLACVCVHIKRYPLWYLFDVKLRTPCLQRNSILLLHHQSIDFLIMYLASVWTWPLWLFLFTSLHKEDTPEATNRWAVKTWWEHQMETFFLCYWSFVRGINRSPVNSLHKASDTELWCFLWFAPK